MNLLEMFSGTGSVGLVAKAMGFNVISLDLKNADINTDILKWIINSLIGVTLILSGHLHHARNTAKQKQQELGISNMQIV